MKFILTIFIIGLLMPSCDLLKDINKKKQVAKSDSTAIHNKDTTRVINNYYNNKSDSTWYREIINFLPKGRDTTINNTTVPVNNYYPAQIIKEGGSFSKEDVKRLIDSMNSARSDTTHVASEVTTKEKEKKLPVVLLICIGFGILIIFGVIGLVILSKTHTSIKTLKQ